MLDPVHQPAWRYKVCRVAVDSRYHHHRSIEQSNALVRIQCICQVTGDRKYVPCRDKSTNVVRVNGLREVTCLEEPMRTEQAHVSSKVRKETRKQRRTMMSGYEDARRSSSDWMRCMMIWAIAGIKSLSYLEIFDHHGWTWALRAKARRSYSSGLSSAKVALFVRRGGIWELGKRRRFARVFFAA